MQNTIDELLPMAITAAKYSQLNITAQSCLDSIYALEKNKATIEVILSKEEIASISKAVASLLKLKLMTQPEDAVKFLISSY